MDEKVLSVDNIMSRYGIKHRETAVRLFKTKGFGGFKIGHRWYVREKDLLKYEDLNKAW